MQAFGELHETSYRRPKTLAVGVGVLWIFQEAPFQASARVTVLALVNHPTATQAVADVQDTADSDALGGLGVA